MLFVLVGASVLCCAYLIVSDSTDGSSVRGGCAARYVRKVRVGTQPSLRLLIALSSDILHRTIEAAPCVYVPILGDLDVVSSNYCPASPTDSATHQNLSADETDKTKMTEKKHVVDDVARRCICFDWTRPETNLLKRISRI